MKAEVKALRRCFAIGLAERIAILELANQAQAKVMGGVKPGDLRWSHPARDFFWTDASRDRVFMDAYQFITLARRVMEHGEERRLRALASPTHAPATPTRAPAKAGAHSSECSGCSEGWIPAFAGMRGRLLG